MKCKASKKTIGFLILTSFLYVSCLKAPLPTEGQTTIPGDNSGQEDTEGGDDKSSGDDSSGITEMEIKFRYADRNSPSSVCNLVNAKVIVSDRELCSNASTPKDISSPAKLYVVGVRPGSYKIAITFANNKKVVVDGFTHDHGLLIPFSSDFVSSGSFTNGKINSIEIDFLSPPLQIEASLYEDLDIQALLSSPDRIDVADADQLRRALDGAMGGEVIVLRANIRDKEFKYYARKPFNSMVYLIGQLPNGDAPHLDQAIWGNIKNMTFVHLKVNRRKISYTSWGFTSDYAWQVRGGESIRLTDVHIFGSDDGAQLLERGSKDGVFNDPRGIFFRQSSKLLIDNCLFEDLFHAVEFQDVDQFYAVSNVADKVTSDMFSGGGIQNSIFESNLSLTKYPINFTVRGKKHYVHSDVIQFYTTGRKTPNQNIEIRNNIALAGNSPVENPMSAGWQCFFTRDEVGDQGPSKVLPYTKVRIYNNLCVSNQHHGVTMGRGYNNYVANNTILELRGAPMSITAGIRINRNHNSSVFSNVAKRIYFTDTDDLNIFNNYQLDRNDPWVVEFNSDYVSEDKLRIPLRGPASDGVTQSYFDDIKGINLKNLGNVRF